MTEKPCSESPPALISPWRRFCQWLTTLSLLLLPWFKIDGNSLLRVDIPDLTLYFFGQALRIEELYLVLLFTLVVTLGFLLVTMLLGRVWCGWFCPQTTLTDLSDWFTKRLGLQDKKLQGTGKTVRKGVLQLIHLLLAFLVAANLLWYFIEPHTFFLKLSTGQLHEASWISLLLITLTIYLDLALVRRLMCSDFCPYGRFQTVLTDQSTLTLHLPPAELERCIQCQSCVRTCPMKIDIRQGIQIECINCGRCLDACRQVMAKRNQPGLISYTFGTTGKGIKSILNARTLLLSLATLTLLGILFVAVYNRPSASLKLSLSHTVSSRILSDGNRATFFNAWVNNRSKQKSLYTIRAREKESGQSLTLKGQTSGIELEPGENLRIDFVLVTAVPETEFSVEFVLVGQSGEELAVTEARIRE